jgi:hypothetical protein
VVQGHGSQVQVALTNISGVAPAVVVAEVSFNAGTVPLGDSGQDVLTGTTATFRSDPFGVLGPTPLIMNVNLDIKNDAGTVSAQFCTVGAP